MEKIINESIEFEKFVAKKCKKIIHKSCKLSELDKEQSSRLYNLVKYWGQEGTLLIEQYNSQNKIEDKQR